MNKAALKEFLDEKVIEYNNPSFIETDPIQIPHQFLSKEDIEIAINLNNLKQILRRAKANDTLTLELVDNKLKIQLKSNTTRTFSLPIIELEDKEQRVRT